MGRIIDFVCYSTKTYIEKMPKSQRKKLGQFFTSEETAVFMANMFVMPKSKKEITILDAGAGTGILSAAIIERLQECKYVEKIFLTCYETDENVLEVLQDNLDWVSENSKIIIEYIIIKDNYILSQQDDFNKLHNLTKNPLKFDYVIGNPPYMKISKDAAEARAMPTICHGAPNLYFLFASMSLFNLNKQGEMVYIIPRSWTSGAYFKRFRQYLLDEGALHHIHLFVSRNKIFDKESVLQETIILKVKKSKIKPDKITLTKTNDNSDYNAKTSFQAPYNIVVSGVEKYVYLVTDKVEVEILGKLNKWDNTLPSLGLKMKTGLTVDFRNKEYLRDVAGEKTVPLFYSQHIKDGKIHFPVGKKNEFIDTEQKGLLQQNRNYLFIKRFTAKEESRRLQCGVYLAKKYPEYEMISTQNKINFIGGLFELSECVVFGLYVLFNSSIYDSYYRILNGSTQVNSTEINSIPMPPLTIIEQMGKELISQYDMSEMSCNKILGSYS